MYYRHDVRFGCEKEGMRMYTSMNRKLEGGS